MIKDSERKQSENDKKFNSTLIVPNPFDQDLPKITKASKLKNDSESDAKKSNK